MKVLVVHPGFTVYGGAELVVVRLCNYLAKNHIEHTLLCGNIDSNARRDLKDTPIEIPYTTRDEVMNIKTWLNENVGNFDVVNLHNHPVELLLDKECPSVWNCNEPATDQLKGIDAPQLWLDKIAKIDKIIVSDKINRDRVAKYYKREDSIINTYGVDIEFWSKREQVDFRKKYDLENQFVILHTGWFNEFKGQMETTKALVKLRSEIPNIKVIFAGFSNTPEAGAIAELAARENLGGHIAMTGHLNRRVLKEVASCADLCVFPFKEQGGWLSPFEMLCAGVPIMLYPTALAADLVREHNLGEITTDLSKSILEFYRNNTGLSKMTSEGRDWVTKNMTWDRFCGKVVETMECVVK